MRTEHLTNMTTPGLHSEREACLWLIDSNYQRCSEPVTEDHADDADRISDEIDRRANS